MENTNNNYPTDIDNYLSDVLYSKDSNGKIRIWQIVAGEGTLQTITGLQDGKKVISTPTICVPKNVGRSNETTAKEQAVLEAKARFKQKIDEGYKENIKDVDIKLFVEPMLAEKFTEHKELVQSLFDNKKYVFHSPKLDGMRCIISKDGMFSRKGKPILSAPHIFEALKPIFQERPNIIFDGELYADKLSKDFNKLISLAKKKKPTKNDLKESQENLEYHVYDMVECSSNFSERFDLLSSLLSEFNPPSVKIVETILVHSMEELNQAYEDYLESGYEGQMIRLDEVYENKRTTSLLKRKEFITEEFLVVDVLEGIGNRSGMAGKIILANKYNPGKTFESNLKGNYDYYRYVLKNKKKFIGKWATVKYFNLTPKEKAPRFGCVVELDRQDA